MSATAYMEAVMGRRSRYDLGSDLEVSEDRILELVREVVQAAPTAGNAQGSKVVVLLGAAHLRFWDLVVEIFQGRLSEERFPKTRKKLLGFKAGTGTVLFYEDEEILEGLKEKYARHGERYETWAMHGSGMQQFALWTAFSAEGIGASLQHYNPVIDEAVKEAFHIPGHFRLVAQMPFGRILSEPEPKEKRPVEEKVLVRR